jgi:RNA recognition motif-containing protein
MAFVAFSDRALAEKAKEETQGKFLEGRDLKVNFKKIG